MTMSKIMENKDAHSLAKLVCGSQLGKGAYRTVYECRLNPVLVLKLDVQYNRSNISEYLLWAELQGTALGQWLAPVEWMSEDGRWLAQQRTTSLREHELPSKVPALFCDLKIDNWGLLDGRPVCHDYGNTLLYALVQKHGKKLVKASWD